MLVHSQLHNTLFIISSFQGVLLVTVRKPFDIGDRIHISRPENDTAPDGSMAWFVENITLYATTVRFAATNEVATIANGNLANTRIINAARSPRMVCSIYMKFGINVPFEKLQFFRETLEEFIKVRVFGPCLHLRSLLLISISINNYCTGTTA